MVIGILKGLVIAFLLFCAYHGFKVADKETRTNIKYLAKGVFGFGSIVLAGFFALVLFG
ncbi:hypothetical protein [Synechococcus phage BUCT-ZZ01]|nr:hypothetical protein [Synechococcus phage BUCT-ZZ01]